MAARKRGKPSRPTSCNPVAAGEGPSTCGSGSTKRVAELDRVSEGRSLRAVARAYVELAEVASGLAAAVERQGSGQRAPAAEAGRPSTVRCRLARTVASWPARIQGMVPPGRYGECCAGASVGVSSMQRSIRSNA